MKCNIGFYTNWASPIPKFSEAINLARLPYDGELVCQLFPINKMYINISPICKLPPHFPPTPKTFAIEP